MASSIVEVACWRHGREFGPLDIPRELYSMNAPQHLCEMTAVDIYRSYNIGARVQGPQGSHMICSK